MPAPIHTRTFKSGNSVAVRLPKGLGIGPNEMLEIRRSGDSIIGRLVPTEAEEAERKRCFMEALEELRRLGPVGEIEPREPFEFPDRPGL
jgi:antitoxin VapB